MHNGGKENGNVIFGRTVNHVARWEDLLITFPLYKMIHNPTKYADVAILLPTVMHSPTVVDYPA